MDRLDGPRIEPSDGEASCLVVLLHGYGADGSDLIELGRVWRAALPFAVFVAPDAPEPLPHPGLGGRQWFPLTFRDPSEYWRGVTAAAPVLERFLAEELARYCLDPDRLALVGFSQGTMLALHIGVRREPPPFAVVGYSGLLAGPEHLSRDIRARPPVLLVHGAEDDLIPVEAMHAARETLAAAGVPVEWHVAEQVGHGISAEGARLGAAFLRQTLGSRGAAMPGSAA